MKWMLFRLQSLGEPHPPPVQSSRSARASAALTAGTCVHPPLTRTSDDSLASGGCTRPSCVTRDSFKSLQVWVRAAPHQLTLNRFVKNSASTSPHHLKLTRVSRAGM